MISKTKILRNLINHYIISIHRLVYYMFIVEYDKMSILPCETGSEKTFMIQST